jgi:hypothetical protein
MEEMAADLVDTKGAGGAHFLDEASTPAQAVAAGHGADGDRFIACRQRWYTEALFSTVSFKGSSPFDPLTFKIIVLREMLVDGQTYVRGL